MDIASSIVILLLIITIFSSSTKKHPISKDIKTPSTAILEKGRKTNSTETIDPLKKGTKEEKILTNNLQLTWENTNYNFLPETSEKAETIYKFIIKTRKNVPDYEAELIANTIVFYSQKKGINPFLIAALIDRESGFNARAISKHGAKGLGQLMDFNLQALNVNDPFSIEESARATVEYFNHLMTIWKNEPLQVKLSLASYLEGPNAIRRNKKIWKKTTEKYINDILKTLKYLES